jgi:hypothetical protein
MPKRATIYVRVSTDSLEGVEGWYARSGLVEIAMGIGEAYPSGCVAHRLISAEFTICPQAVRGSREDRPHTKSTERDQPADRKHGRQ